MKTYILIYRHLLVILWEICILVLFKLTTNFTFYKGLSIVFIGLIIIFPLIIYIWSSNFIRQNKIKHHIKTKGYFEGIKKDQSNQVLTQYLINPLRKLEYNIDVEVDEDRILILIKNINQVIMLVEFNKQRAKLTILNTLVIYRFYYSYVTGEFTKYDFRNFEYQETKILYNKILEIINQLANHKYIYIQKNHQIKLSRMDINEDVYVRKIPLLISHKLDKKKLDIKL